MENPQKIINKRNDPNDSLYCVFYIDESADWDASEVFYALADNKTSAENLFQLAVEECGRKEWISIFVRLISKNVAVQDIFGRTQRRYDPEYKDKRVYPPIIRAWYCGKEVGDYTQEVNKDRILTE